jgi:2-amino-4-hydroxy-6-hydroxymethyldihydropteridine diphosphokinase
MTGRLPYGYRNGGTVRSRQCGAILYHLGLGSNLGDRAAHIEEAVAFLQSCGRLLKKSAVYETTPVGMAGAPLFLNMVVALESQLAPPALLSKCKDYEVAQGRNPKDSPGANRPIDIDILLAGGMVVATPELTIPHPRLHERAFVLVPLFEIAPKLVHPVENVTVARLLARLHSNEKVVRIE